MQRAEFRRSSIAPRLILGLMLILVGFAYTFDQLDLYDAGDLLRLWPLILLAAGLGKLFWPGSSTSRWNGLLLCLAGSWLLLENLDLIHISFWDWWPLVLVAIGVRLVWSGTLGRADEVKTENLHRSASSVNAVAVLGGASRTNNCSSFEGGDLIAFMGGCEIDLRGARIDQSPATIDAFAFWGGIDIRVPEDWQIDVQGIPLLGAYEDSTKTILREGEPAQVLLVKGFAIMGGVEVKN